MVWPERDDWTVVTRGRKRTVQGNVWPMPRTYHNPVQHTRVERAPLHGNTVKHGGYRTTWDEQGGRMLSYADIVKYGGHRRVAPTHRGQLQQRSDRPQFFETRALSGPVTFTPRPKAITKRARHREQNGVGTARWFPRDKNTYPKRNTKPERSDDPEFVTKTRLLFKIIKLIHHKNNVSHEQPPSINKIEKHLSEIIKPALPNATTYSLIEGNAKNWAYTTMLILKNHYEDALGAEMAKLQHLSSRDWEKCLNTAIVWAKRGIGKRLKDKTLQEAQGLVRETWQTVPVPTDPVQREGETGTQNPPPSPPQTQNTPVRAVTVQALIHTGTGLQSPPVRSVTASTMTDPLHEWSPLREEEPDSDLDTSLHLLSSPKAQRGPRRRPNPCVRQEEDDLICFEDLGECEREKVTPPEAISSPNKITSLKTATQARLSLGPGASPALHCDGLGDRPSRHIATKRKSQWTLTARRKFLIIGDSNLSRMPPFKNPDLQIESYPGAKFAHIKQMLEKNTVSTDTEHVIFSLGINGRTNNVNETAIKGLQGLLRTAKEKFPRAEIWVPVVNFSPELPPNEQIHLDTLNAYITRNLRHIPALPSSEFQTKGDRIHWTADTAGSMLQHWLQYLN